MMAYNNRLFLDAALIPLIKSEHVNQIVAVEGAWSPNCERQRSEDGTIVGLEYFKNYSDIEFNSKLHVLYWDQIDPKTYRDYQCDRHEEIVCFGALLHRYYDPLALQQQLLARDWGLREIIRNIPKEEDDGWLWIVDSDEVYLPEQINQMVEFLEVVGDDHDMFAIQGKNFYFNGKQYHNEWYRRLFKIKENCFFSDDNSLEVPRGNYLRTMNIPPEIVEFFHYGYCSEFRVKKKLEMWRQDSVSKWWNQFGEMVANREKYDGSPVHLFGDKNPGYANYRLAPYTGDHPESVKEILKCLEEHTKELP